MSSFSFQLHVRKYRMSLFTCQRDLTAEYVPPVESDI